MTTRPYELLIRFAPNGSIAGASVRYITTVNGRDYEGDPVPLQGVDDPAFAAFAEQFGAAAIAERDQARAELAAMTASREAEIVRAQSSESERDSLASSLAEMTGDRDNALARVAELESALSSAQSELGSAEARILELQSQLPWDPRIIDASAFLSRISQAELLDLTTSGDPVKQQIAAMLAAYRANDWPIMLDSPEMQEAIGYLTQSGMITAEQAGELLRDSTREESYRAGE